MSTYRKRGKYYTSADYYSNTAYQEYSDDDYIESTDEYPYQDYQEDTGSYSEDSQGYQDYGYEGYGQQYNYDGSQQYGYDDYSDGSQQYGYDGYSDGNQQYGYDGYSDGSQQYGYDGYSDGNQQYNYDGYSDGSSQQYGYGNYDDSQQYNYDGYSDGSQQYSYDGYSDGSQQYNYDGYSDGSSQQYSYGNYGDNSQQYGYDGYSDDSRQYDYDGYSDGSQQTQDVQPSQPYYQQPYQRYRQYGTHSYNSAHYQRESQTYQRPDDSQASQKTEDAPASEDESKISKRLVTEPEGHERLRLRQNRQHRRMREEKLRRRRRRLMIALAARLACLLIALTAVILLFRLIFFSNPVKRKVTVEAGTTLDIKDFLKKDKVKGKFVTDISKVSLDHVGEQEIILKVKGKERKSRLIVKDTKPPKAEAVTATIDVDGKLKAKELVDNIKDATDVKCSFKKKPDLSKKGKISTVVILTDEGGNTTKIESDIKVIIDKEPPVIDGVAPLTGFIGEPISYKSSITVTDNCVRDIDVTVDNSKVDTKTEGTYDVYYTAVDRAGNKAEASTTITIKEKPENYVTPEEVYEEADEVLKEITTKGMTKKEKARAIYEWAREEIGYVSKADKDSWTNGAHQGFTEKSGDCFVFYATSKALLTQAGIPNLDVVKSDTSHSSHYWSLIDCGDGWYHFDTTPRQGGGDDFFMKTDDEILEYSENHRDSHIFDRSLYPATPTEDSTIE